MKRVREGCKRDPALQNTTLNDEESIDILRKRENSIE